MIVRADMIHGLRVPKETASALVHAYFARYPEMKVYMDKMKRRVATEPIICTCFEVRHSKSTKRKQRMHGRMTLRGSFGSNGMVRYKCRNKSCGKTTYLRPRPITPQMIASR